MNALNHRFRNLSGDKREDIEARVMRVVADLLNANIEALTPKTKLVGNLGADSLDQAELIIELEDDFEIDISEKKASSIHTIKDIVDAVESILEG